MKKIVKDDPQTQKLNTSNSGFYKASSDEEGEAAKLFDDEPKLNNFIPMLAAANLKKPIKRRHRSGHQRKNSAKEKNDKRFGAPVDLRSQKFSIKNDLFFGWKPKIGIKNPFPLFYNDRLIQNLETLCNYLYRGFRPVHSYKLHEYFSGQGKYPYSNKSFSLYMNEEIKELMKLNVKHDLPELKPSGCQAGSPQVEFDSFFESGNCDLVVESSHLKYDVYLRVDSNTRGHTHWFYFRVRSERMTQANIRIRNMSKGDSIFRKWGNPYISYDNKSWTQLEQSKYYQTFFGELEIDPRPPGYRSLHTLEFNVKLSSDSWVYISYCPPYPFSRLSQFLKKLEIPKKAHIVRKEVFCRSESGLESPMLTITEFEKLNALTTRKQRPIVILTGRVHPGETCSSHMMHGMIDFLLSDEKAAELLRELFEFVVIPMLNTDGVILGNFRTGLAGDDLNRQYLKPEAEFHPSIITLLNKVAKLRSERKVAMYMDLHGHSTKPNVFSYGPELARNDSMYDFVKFFPKMIDLESVAFKFSKCSWKINKCKKATARAVFLNQMSKKKFQD